MLLALHNAAPYEAHEAVLLSTIQAIYADATQNELRRDLHYLEHRKLIQIRKDPKGPWFAELDRYGTDIVEYSVDCDPGVNRPVKWG
jgi:hypothetical protein